ncbi:serine hydrolase [Fulvivirgaceae bacterium PWU5]|uniref:Serine hydrolase n=1 Tax=Dawidia cretensis TaxID=2782350 RepID=A0AAP2E1L7_9BACT|nr:serine hydrolase [Dawidia cretensis]MBT1710328.1 serine hydrolase [Dawidia cretensis]
MENKYIVLKNMAQLGCCLLLIFVSTRVTLAHNGANALVYPLKNIQVDGDLSDWIGVKRHILALAQSDVKPQNAEDFSGYFMIGYNLGEKTLYVAIEITDSDYVVDTTRQVGWNTQDGVQVCLDVRHLIEGSGVTAYSYSETRKYVDANKWDAATKQIVWDKADIKMVRKGNKRMYEYKIYLGEALQPGRSMGFDMLVFDKDADGFGWNAWGDGEGKYQNSHALGDIVFMKENEKGGTLTGQMKIVNTHKIKVPARLRFTATASPQTWIVTSVDSLGNYSTQLPGGSYTVALSDKYIPEEAHVYTLAMPSHPNVKVKPSGLVKIPAFSATVTEAPDLVPDKGVMPTFDNQSPSTIDNFIETYQQYYKIPGVSLALIKDGKVIYHKVYGVKNSMTQAPLSDSTLFEAASITKPVFAYAVQRLAERGLIDLDKPLYQYLPFKDIEYDDRYKLITARHVITHRTGFPNWRDGKLVINFTPGTQFGYSGEGFQYLQAVVKSITGKSTIQMLTEEVLDPLDMHHTFFAKNARLMKLVSTGHFNNIPSSDDPTEAPGMAFSMHTEALEFTHFMLQLLNQKGLSPATYTNILSERSPYPQKDGEEKPKYKVYMGESLEVRESPFGQVFGHGGNNGDFRCQFEVYKDARMGYVIFTNSSTAYPLIEKMRLLLVEGKQ